MQGSLFPGSTQVSSTCSPLFKQGSPSLDPSSAAITQPLSTHTLLAEQRAPHHMTNTFYLFIPSVSYSRSSSNFLASLSHFSALTIINPIQFRNTFPLHPIAYPISLGTNSLGPKGAPALTHHRFPSWSVGLRVSEDKTGKGPDRASLPPSPSFLFPSVFVPLHSSGLVLLVGWWLLEWARESGQGTIGGPPPAAVSAFLYGCE